MEQKQRMKELVEILNRASEAYYGGREEILSNYEWDALFDELVLLEEALGEVLPESPTQNTGYEEKSGEREVHEFPALSLAKTKSIDDLKKWAGDKEVWLSWKLDGLTLVLTYDEGKLTKILTRGNGTSGSNITFMKEAISGFPQSISYKGHMVVRGEAVISYSDFELLNATIEDDDEKYANPRNLASGTLGLDKTNLDKVKERHVQFFAFSLVYIDEELNTIKERMDLLDKEGFRTVEREKCNADSLKDAVERWTTHVESGKFDFPVDGLVIGYDDHLYAQAGSVTGHHATRGGLAFKWEDVCAETILKYVEWSCAASTISPVAVFEPVALEGTTVSRASLCNLSEMERLGIGEDNKTHLKVIKANKIIPKCIEVTKAEGTFEWPKVCPVCQAATVVKISEKSLTKTLHCTNPNCTAKHVKKFTRFVSKSGVDVDGLSIQTIIRFMNLGYLKDFADIYTLANYKEEIARLEGFGEKSCSNLLEAIEKSRKVHPVHLIYALCIPLIGTDAGKKLIGAFGTDGFLQRLKTEDGFEEVEGIGPEKSNSIVQWYKDDANKALLDKLLKELQVENVEVKSNSGGLCEGLTFVVTGDVYQFKNRDELKAYVEAQNGTVTGSVSKKTDYLINNDLESASSKNKKAKELGIPIISEEQFIQKFGR